MPGCARWAWSTDPGAAAQGSGTGRTVHTMRVTSDLFVSALVRRVFGSGGYAAVTRRGSFEAGAVFVTVRDRSGTITLHAPAAQADYRDEGADERRFAVVASGDDEAIEARIQKELRFDQDIWVVEVEPGEVPVSSLLSLTTP